MSGESNDPRDQSYFEWGKSGGDDYGAFVDYMALNTTEASAPGEGSPLPGDLFPGSVATFEPLLQAALRVYPNPASDIVTVELPAGSNYTGQLFSIDGRAATGTFTLGQGYNINVSTLRKGLYVLMVRSQAGEMARAKLLID
jgi:hypothetical protein